MKERQQMKSKRRFILAAGIVVLLFGRQLGVAAVQGSTGCAEVRPHVYSDGARLLAEKDLTLQKREKSGVFNVDPVAPVLGIASGIAVLFSDVPFMEAQGVSSQGEITPKNGGSMPTVYHQSCSPVTVYTVDGVRKLPMFVLGGTVVLEDLNRLTYVNFGGAYRPFTYQNCVLGDIRAITGRTVLVVGRLSSEQCTIKRGRAYFQTESKKPLLLTSRLAKTLLASYVLPRNSPSPLDTALLLEG
jgi:hypothetical protein